MKRKILACAPPNDRLILPCTTNPRAVASCEGYESYVAIGFYNVPLQWYEDIYYPFPACDAGTRNRSVYYNYGCNTPVCVNVPGAPTPEEWAYDYTINSFGTPYYRDVETIFGIKRLPKVWYYQISTGQTIYLGVNRSPPTAEFPQGKTSMHGDVDLYYRPDQGTCNCKRTITGTYQCPCCAPFQNPPCQVQYDNEANSGPFHNIYLPCPEGQSSCWNYSTPQEKNVAYRNCIRYNGRVTVDINIARALTDGELYSLAVPSTFQLFMPELRPLLTINASWSMTPRSWGTWTGSPNLSWMTYSLWECKNEWNSGEASFQWSWPYGPNYCGWQYTKQYEQERFGYIPVNPNITCLNESSTPNNLNVYDVTSNLHMRQFSLGNPW